MATKKATRRKRNPAIKKSQYACDECRDKRSGVKFRTVDGERIKLCDECYNEQYNPKAKTFKVPLYAQVNAHATITVKAENKKQAARIVMEKAKNWEYDLYDEGFELDGDEVLEQPFVMQDAIEEDDED